MQISIPLLANKPSRQTFTRAMYLVIVQTGDAASVDVSMEVAGFPREEFRGLKRGDRITAPAGGFEAAIFTTTVDATVEVAASVFDLRLNNYDGQVVSAVVDGAPVVTVEGQTVKVENDPGGPLGVLIDDTVPVQVETTRGDSALNPLHVSGAVLGDTPAQTVTDNAAVVASDVAATLVAADATRLEMVVFNQGPDPVALGMAGLTWAKRAIVIDAGDTWVEQRAASQGWKVITAAGGAASVTVQERKS